MAELESVKRARDEKNREIKLVKDKEKSYVQNRFIFSSSYQSQLTKLEGDLKKIANVIKDLENKREAQYEFDTSNYDRRIHEIEEEILRDNKNLDKLKLNLEEADAKIKDIEVKMNQIDTMDDAVTEQNLVL